MVAAAEKVFDEIETPIGGVLSDNVLAIWDRVEPILRRVVKPQTGHTLDSVLMNLLLGKQQLWVIGDFEAVGITEIQVRPAQKVIWCQFIAGDNVADWIGDWEQVLVEYGRAHDCAAVEFCGRRGWAKFQNRFRNFRPMFTTYRSEIDG